MKILVTGGLGTLGRPLVEELRTRGNEVWVCDFPQSPSPQYIRCDVSKYRQLERIFAAGQFDLVYHLAAEFGRANGEDYYENLWVTNVVGTKNMIRLQEKHRFRMVYLSSSEVYGGWSGIMQEYVTDKYEIKQLNDYAMTKWVSENQILNSAIEFGTETVRVRPFNTYGPGEYYSPYRSVIAKFIYYALNDIPYTVHTNHKRTLTYVADMIGTIANISEKFIAGEVYNISGDQHRSIKYFSDLILDYLGKNDSLVTYSESEVLTTADKQPDCRKAVAEIDHNCLFSVEKGIPLTVDWMTSVIGKS